MTPAVAGAVAGALVLGCAGGAAAAARAQRARGVRRRLGAIPPAGRRSLLEGDAPAWLAGGLAAAGVAQSPAPLWRAWVLAGAVVVGAALLAAGPGLAALALVAVVGGPWGLLVALRGRSDRLVEAGLPHALEAVARALRSGASLRQGLTEAAEAAPPTLAGELRRVDRDVRLGVPLIEALEAWTRRRPLPGVRLAVAALSLGIEAGGAHARAVDGVAATVRGRLALRAEVRALSAQAQASAGLLVAVPLLFCAFAVATNPGTADFLLRSPLGLACLAGGLGLDALAALWMTRLTRTDR